MRARPNERIPPARASASRSIWIAARMSPSETMALAIQACASAQRSSRPARAASTCASPANFRRAGTSISQNALSASRTSSSHRLSCSAGSSRLVAASRAFFADAHCPTAKKLFPRLTCNSHRFAVASVFGPTTSMARSAISYQCAAFSNAKVVTA